MRKIALPVANSLLSPHFGHPEYFYIFEANENTIEKEEMHVPPAHTPGSYPKWMADMGVTDIIVGGIGQMAINLFNSNGINVYIGAAIKNPKELAKELLQGTLVSKENLCNHDGDHDHGHHHHHN
ncbi:MAG: NifB/NifX family molybdenum-iron cluster-binding protein [Bacteroidota bacterium]